MSINESVICANILSCFGLSNIEMYRTVSRCFNDTVRDMLSDVTVIGSCGLYKKDDQWYMPSTDKKFMKGIIIKDDDRTIYFQRKIMTIDVTLLKLPKINKLVRLGSYMIWEHVGNEISYFGFGMENVSSEDLIYLRNICFRGAKQCDIKITEAHFPGNYSDRNIHFSDVSYSTLHRGYGPYKITTQFSLLVTNDHMSIKSNGKPRLLTKFIEYINALRDTKNFEWRDQFNKITLDDGVANFTFFEAMIT